MSINLPMMCFGGGGGGGSGISAVRMITGSRGGDITTTSQTAVDLTGFSVSLPAVAGDLIHASLTCAIFSSSGSNVVLSFHIGASTGRVDITSESLSGSNAHTIPVDYMYQVAAGDIDGGSITVKVQWRAGSAVTLNLQNDATNLPQLRVMNFGQVVLS